MELLQERLFSSGLHILGSKPSNDDLRSYLSAFFDDALTEEEYEIVLHSAEIQNGADKEWNFMDFLTDFGKTIGLQIESQEPDHNEQTVQTAKEIVSLLNRNTEELDGILNLLDGGYLPPCPGGDLLRDGTSVLPTGRNIHGE